MQSSWLVVGIQCLCIRIKAGKTEKYSKSQWAGQIGTTRREGIGRGSCGRNCLPHDEQRNKKLESVTSSFENHSTWNIKCINHCYCIFGPKEVVKISAISEKCVQGYIFQNLTDFYSKPNPSSQLGIFQCSELSTELREWDVEKSISLWHLRITKLGILFLIIFMDEH